MSQRSHWKHSWHGRNARYSLQLEKCLVLVFSCSFFCQCVAFSLLCYVVCFALQRVGGGLTLHSTSTHPRLLLPPFIPFLPVLKKVRGMMGFVCLRRNTWGKKQKKGMHTWCAVYFTKHISRILMSMQPLWELLRHWLIAKKCYFCLCRGKKRLMLSRLSKTKRRLTSRLANFWG